MKSILVVIILISMNQAYALDFLNPFLRFIKPNGPLIGEDINENGIRDDVEVAINEKYKDKNKRSVFLLLAHHYESLLRSGLDEKFKKDWWRNNEKINNCSHTILFYGYGWSSLEKFNNINFLINLTYNRTNRWDTYINMYNNSYHYGNVHKKNLDPFDQIIMMKDLCSFDIENYELLFDSSLNRILPSYGDSKNIPQRFKKFEKDHGTKYRKTYEKYYK